MVKVRIFPGGESGLYIVMQRAKLPEKERGRLCPIYSCVRR